MTVGVFIDLETTGLDLTRGEVLEIGMLAFNIEEAEPIDEFEYTRRFSSDQMESACCEEVLAMHLESGLALQCYHARESAGGMWSDAIDWLSNIRASAGGGHLLTPFGNGFDRFDRLWIREASPFLLQNLTYYSIDVSGFRRTLQSFGAEAPPRTAVPHRALPDCRAEFAEWKLLRSRWMQGIWPGDGE